MNRNIIIRSISLMLTVVLLLPALPMKAEAHYEVPIYRTEETFELDGFSGHIYEFELVQKEICGFYLGYRIDEVVKGDLEGDFNIEVCVHDTSGNWFVAEMFTYDTVGEDIREEVSWDDPRDIDQFAVIVRKPDLSWYQSLYIANPMVSSYEWQERISCDVSDEQLTRSGSSAYPYVLKEALNGCYGFTLHFEVDEIKKGSLTCTTEYDVYVCSDSGSWKKVYTFTMLGDEAIVDVSWKDKINVQEIAVLCRQDTEYSFSANMAFSDALYEPADTAGKSAYSSNGSEGDSGYLSGYWSDTQFKRSGNYSYPYVLNTPLKKCKGFSLDYAITEVTSGKMKSDSKFAVFVCSTDGTWTRVKEFNLDDYEASVTIKLDKATTITQVAIQCMNAGTFTYNYNLGLYDPVY